MNPAEARRHLEARGVLDDANRVIAESPPLPPHVIEKVRRLLNTPSPRQPDEGLDVHEHGKTLDVRCHQCGTVLVVTEKRNGSTTAKDLALTNVTRNPCCDRWR